MNDDAYGILYKQENKNFDISIVTTEDSDLKFWK